MEPLAGDEQKKRQLDRNKKLRELKGKDFRPPAWLCGKCYSQLREKGQIRLNNGQTRQWITRSSANVAEDTSEQPAAKGSKKKGKTPKKSNDLDDALLQQHKDLVSAIRSLSTTTETPAPEPAPEPAPAPTMSHSSMTAALLQAALDRTTRPATAQMAEAVTFSVAGLQRQSSSLVRELSRIGLQRTDRARTRA